MAQIKVLKLGHAELSLRYLGHTKTLNRIVSQFYWSCQYLDIRDLAQVPVKSPRKKIKVPVINLSITGEPFLRIAMDIV